MVNARQLQYVIALSRVRNFSAVAEKLNISQPALSKQILSLEKELGVKLFDISENPLSLTPAGEEFIRQAQELLYQEDQLKRSMEQFRSGEAGRLTIGISPFRSMYLLSDMVKKVREKYPSVQITLCEAPSDQLRKEAAEGKYDFAVVNLPVDETVLEVMPLEADTLVLAVPDGLLDKLCDYQPREKLDLQKCGCLPFVVVSKNQEMRQLFDRMCTRAQIQPPIAVEVVGVATSWEMVCAGVGAALVPLQFVKNKNTQGVTLLHIQEGISTRQPVIVTRYGQHQTQHAQYAIELLTGK